jgi:O-antigen/teichoic acid export membrane protein
MRAVARGGVVNLVGVAFAGLAGVGVTWLVARGLGPVQAGAFFAATAAFVLVGGVAKLGAPTSLVYWPARLRARGEPHLLGACLRIGLPPVAVAGFAAGTALWLFAPRLAALTGGAATGAGTGPGAGTGGQSAAQFVAQEAILTDQLRMLAVFLPLAALTDALLSASRGYRAMGPTVLLDRITRPALQLLGIGGLVLATAWTPVPLAAYPLAWVGPYAPVVLLAAYHLHRVHAAAVPGGAAAGNRQHRAVRQRRATHRRLRRDFWRFAGPRAVASVAQLALQRVDVLLVAALGGLAAAALYAVAGRFVVLGQFANQGISQAVQPRLAETLATGDRAGAKAFYQTATGWLVLITWPLYLTVLMFAPLYLGLFGDGYRTGGRIVAVLACAMLLATACGMVDMVLAMGGRTGWNLANVGLALAVTITLDLLLIPRYGAFGAAIGLAAALAVNNLLPLTQLAVGMRLHPFGRGTVTAVALALTCFGGVPIGVLTVVGAGPTGLAISLAAGAAGYLVGIYALRRPLAIPRLPLARRPGGQPKPDRQPAARPPAARPPAARRAPADRSGAARDQEG